MPSSGAASAAYLQFAGSTTGSTTPSRTGSPAPSPTPTPASPSRAGTTGNSTLSNLASMIAFPGAVRSSSPAPIGGISRPGSPAQGQGQERTRVQSSPISSTSQSQNQSHSHLQSPSNTTRLTPLRTASPSPSRPRDGEGSFDLKRQVCPTCGRGMDLSGGGGGGMLSPGGSGNAKGKSPLSSPTGGKGRKLENDLEQKKPVKEGKVEGERGRTRTSISRGSGENGSNLLPGFVETASSSSPSTVNSTTIPTSASSSIPTPVTSLSLPTSLPSSGPTNLPPIPEIKSPNPSSSSTTNSFATANTLTSPPSINPTHPNAPPGSAAAMTSSPSTASGSGKVPRAIPDVKERAKEWGKLRALAMSISLGRVEPVGDGAGGGGSGSKAREGTPPGLPRSGFGLGTGSGPGSGAGSPTMERTMTAGLHSTVVEALKRQVREEAAVGTSGGGGIPSSPKSPIIPSNATSPIITSSHSTPRHSVDLTHILHQPSIPSVLVRRSSSNPASRSSSPTRSGNVSGTASPIKGVGGGSFSPTRMTSAGGGSGVKRSRAGSSASLREQGESETVEVLRKALLRVLDDAEYLSSRHENLLSNQLEIENSLKIARSNLVMAEMNAEMLEEALKRGVGGEAFGYSRQGKTPNAAGVPGASHSVQSSGLQLSRPGTPGAGATPRGSMDSTGSGVGSGAAAGAGRVSPGISTQAPPMARRRSGSEAMTPIISPIPKRAETLGLGNPPAQLSQSNPNPNAPPALKRSSTVTGARPGMQRANTATTSSQSGSGVTMNSVSGFMRKSIEKTRPGSGLMREISQGLKINMPESFSELQTLIEDNLPMASPSSSVSRSDFFSQLGMSRPEAANSTPSLGVSADPRRVVSGVPQASRPTVDTSLAAAEVQKLRGNFAASQTTIKALSGELDIMKKAKESLEAELETLSQALFEEANKMVAEERKKRAEMEEEAREAFAERDALKRAMSLMESASGSRMATPMLDGDGGGDERFSLGDDEEIEEGGAGKKASTRKDRSGSNTSLQSDEEAETPGERERTAEEVEALMKRMEEDFGQL